MSQQFKRVKENFQCEQCGRRVQGDGYTNHCPACLWSKHVDVNPGDRLAKCQGLMKPDNISQDHQTYVIHHLCQSCGHQKANRVNAQDQMVSIIKIFEQRLKN